MAERKFKIISIDMFQTLVNVDSRKHIIWQTFLQDHYTPERAERYWNRATELIYEYFKKMVIHQQNYIPVKSIFQTCYAQLFAEIEYDVNPVEAAQILAAQHPLSTPFDDALPFLHTVGRMYPICLASDTDDDMLGSLAQLYPFDHIFTSEQLRAYKIHTGNKFFSAILAHYGVDSQDILHIGDSSSDIVGANRVGMMTCWLNRENRRWSHEQRPDYEISSLHEAVSIIGVDSDS